MINSITGTDEGHNPNFYKSRRNRKRKNRNRGVLIAILTAVIVAVVAVSAIVYVAYSKKDSLIVTVDSVPEEVQSRFYTLSGTVRTEENTASLMVNGNTVFDVSKNEGDKIWTYEAVLYEGENSFVITAEDEKGTTVSETVVINYDGFAFTKGTPLVKSDKEGIYVRPVPGNGEDYILYINYNDYNTQLVYLGETQLGDDGYDWYLVSIPDGTEGWVRSENVEPVE